MRTALMTCLRKFWADVCITLIIKRFKKDLKRCEKRGLNIQLIKDAVALLAATGTLPMKYRPHKLSGNMEGQ